MKRAWFPTIDAVEVRTFCDWNDGANHHYRLIKAVFSRAHQHSRYMSLTGDFMLVDVEQGGALIPSVFGFGITRLDLSCVFGRIKRLTADHVELANDVDWKKGYTYVTTPGEQQRVVSEEFILSGVDVLTEVEFPAAKERAEKRYHDLTGINAVAVAWGGAGPAHRLQP